MGGSVWFNILVNLFANLLSALIIGALAVFLVLRVRQRGMKRFFGFRSARNNQKIYLSTIAVQRAGARGALPVREGFHGDAITELEYRHALRLAASITGRSRSWVLDALLGSRDTAERIVSSIELAVPFRHLDLDIEYDDEDGTYDLRQKGLQEKIDSLIDQVPCVVLVGAPIYNLMTLHVVSCYPTHFDYIRKHDGSRGIEERRGQGETSNLRKELPGRVDPTTFEDFFVVEKLTVRTTKVFICAGTSTSATAAALDKLGNWRSYVTEFGDADFGVLYKIVTDAPHGRESEPPNTTTRCRSYPERT